MADEFTAAFQGLVYLGNSAKARVQTLFSVWLAHRQAKSRIGALDRDIERLNRVRYTGGSYLAFNRLIASAESARTNAETAYEKGELDQVKTYTDSGLYFARQARSLLPDEISQHDT